MAVEPDTARLQEIFFPYARARTAGVQLSGNRFVYYTRAEVAASILKNRQIWFRNALCMNDFKEITHGYECLIAAWQSEGGDILKAAMAQCNAALPSDVEAFFNQLLPSINADTYLYCVSEHYAEEDHRGRLSMWRAYGGSTGIALVFNGAVMHASSDVLGAYSSPVLYADPPEFIVEFRKTALSVQQGVPYLRELEPHIVRNAVFQMMRYAMLCTKHPAFREEKEWRVIASPSIHPDGRNKQEVEVINGVPQLVVKIELLNDLERGLTGLALPELLDRIIVGPCECPAVTAFALQSLLADAGVTDPDCIVLADIPLRHDA